MKPEIPLKGGDEYDALTRWRHVVCVFYNHTGLIKRMQRKYWKRVRRYERKLEMEFEKQKFILWLKQYSEYNKLSMKATDAFTGWTGKDPNVIFNKSREVIDVLEEVVTLVERFSRDVDALSSKEKLEAAVECVDDWVKFPFFLEWVDDIIIRYMLCVIVEQKNKWFGKNWFDSVG